MSTVFRPFADCMVVVKKYEKLHVIWCAFGIISALIVYGALQEKVMQWSFNDNGKEEKFTYTLFIVLCNRLVSFLVAVAMLMASGESISPVAPLYKYALVSISNVVATSCQYEALKHISFPLQTLGKCAKMIPVMLWGTCIMRKRYKWIDYLVAILVTMGCTLFFLTGETTAKDTDKEHAMRETVYGVLLMVGYLGFDGFTSTFQDKMFKGYNMSTYNQIMYITMWSSCLSIIGLVSASQFNESVGFVQRHPSAFWNIMTLSAAATVAQLFISHTIKTFGALLFATIMTTRQVISIVLSCILYMHPLSAAQWLSVAMVFGALYYKAYAKDQEKKMAKRATQDGAEQKIVVEF